MSYGSGCEKGSTTETTPLRRGFLYHAGKLAFESKFPGGFLETLDRSKLNINGDIMDVLKGYRCTVCVCVSNLFK